MPNHKLSEYQVKKLWNKFNNNDFIDDYININKLDFNKSLQNNLVVKIDDGSKRRMKRGLIKLNQNRDQVINWIKEQNTQKNYFVEQMNEVSEEYYVMIRIEDNNDVYTLSDIYPNNIKLWSEQYDYIPYIISNPTLDQIERLHPGLISNAYFADLPFIDRGRGSKKDICKALGVDVLIEDSYENLDSCLAHIQRGFLLKRPWNQNIVGLPKKVTRVEDPREILKYF